MNIYKLVWSRLTSSSLLFLLLVSFFVLSCGQEDYAPELPGSTDKLLVISAEDSYLLEKQWPQEMYGINVWLVKDVDLKTAKKGYLSRFAAYFGWNEEGHWFFVWRDADNAEIWKVSNERVTVRQMIIFILETEFRHPEYFGAQYPYPVGLHDYLETLNLKSERVWHDMPDDIRPKNREDLLKLLRHQEANGILDTIFEKSDRCSTRKHVEDAER